MYLILHAIKYICLIIFNIPVLKFGQKERKKGKKKKREKEKEKKEEKEGEKEQFYNAKRHSNNYHMFISRINARQ